MAPWRRQQLPPRLHPSENEGQAMTTADRRLNKLMARAEEGKTCPQNDYHLVAGARISC